jgi:hypothetical protein
MVARRRSSCTPSSAWGAAVAKGGAWDATRRGHPTSCGLLNLQRLRAPHWSQRSSAHVSNCAYCASNSEQSARCVLNSIEEGNQLNTFQVTCSKMSRSRSSLDSLPWRMCRGKWHAVPGSSIASSWPGCWVGPAVLGDRRTPAAALDAPNDLLRPCSRMPVGTAGAVAHLPRATCCSAALLPASS